MLSSNRVPLHSDARARHATLAKTPARTAAKGRVMRENYFAEPQRSVFKDSKPVVQAPSRPLGDKTPLPNRIANTTSFVTPLPHTLKRGKQALHDPGTPETQVVVADVESIADDYDEIEYMPPPIVDRPYEPPFDFEIPNYTTLGRTLLNLAQSSPFAHSPPPSDYEYDNPDLTDPLKWDVNLAGTGLGTVEPIAVPSTSTRAASRPAAVSNLRATTALGTRHGAPSARTTTTAFGARGSSHAGVPKTLARTAAPAAHNPSHTRTASAPNARPAAPMLNARNGSNPRPAGAPVARTATPATSAHSTRTARAPSVLATTSVPSSRAIPKRGVPPTTATSKAKRTTTMPSSVRARTVGGVKANVDGARVTSVDVDRGKGEAVRSDDLVIALEQNDGDGLQDDFRFDV